MSHLIHSPKILLGKEVNILRDKDNFPVILSNLSKQLAQNQSVVKNLKGITSTLINPNLHDYYNLELVLPEYVKFTDLIFLTYSSYLFDENFHWMLRLAIEERIKRYNNEDRQVIEICLESKYMFELFLQETNLFHSRDLFGNIIPRVIKILKNLKLTYIGRPRPTKEERRIGVGYKDKGQLSINDHRIDQSWELDEKERKYQEKLLNQQNTQLFLFGFLG